MVTLNHKNNDEKSFGPEDEKDKKKVKAVALLSGGLDSSLAVRMMLDQGVDVEAIAIKTPFCDFDCGKGCGHKVKEVATELGIRLQTVYFGDEYLKMLKNPKYGYGSGMNPCIDCRGMMYNAAKKHMEKINADFIFTGEVLGQRPMSQNHRSFDIIENETNTQGKILRPLSAKHLPITEIEKEGLVNRKNLENIKGRSRKIQLSLANKYEIIDPPNAAGGCLLTDPMFSKRVKDLYKHEKNVPTTNDIELLKIGRHFRLNADCKLIVGRNESENSMVDSLYENSDWILYAKDYAGPVGLLRGKNIEINEELITISAKIILRYADVSKDKESVVKIKTKNFEYEISTVPFKDQEISSFRI